MRPSASAWSCSPRTCSTPGLAPMPRPRRPPGAARSWPRPGWRRTGWPATRSAGPATSPRCSRRRRSAWASPRTWTAVASCPIGRWPRCWACRRAENISQSADTADRIPMRIAGADGTPLSAEELSLQRAARTGLPVRGVDVDVVPPRRLAHLAARVRGAAVRRRRPAARRHRRVPRRQRPAARRRGAALPRRRHPAAQRLARLPGHARQAGAPGRPADGRLLAARHRHAGGRGGPRRAGPPRPVARGPAARRAGADPGRPRDPRQSRHAQHGQGRPAGAVGRGQPPAARRAGPAPRSGRVRALGGHRLVRDGADAAARPGHRRLRLDAAHRPRALRRPRRRGGRGDGPPRRRRRGERAALSRGPDGEPPEGRVRRHPLARAAHAAQRAARLDRAAALGTADAGSAAARPRRHRTDGAAAVADHQRPGRRLAGGVGRLPAGAALHRRRRDHRGRGRSRSGSPPNPRACGWACRSTGRCRRCSSTPTGCSRSSSTWWPTP